MLGIDPLQHGVQLAFRVLIKGQLWHVPLLSMAPKEPCPKDEQRPLRQWDEQGETSLSRLCNQLASKRPMFVLYSALPNCATERADDLVHCSEGLQVPQPRPSGVSPSCSARELSRTPTV
eukprot:10755472-Alexandrium_andersonii.AAC.1